MEIKNQLLKSVVIPFKKRKPYLLIPKNMISLFEIFLKESIGEELIIINTNIGLGIYYISKNNYSDLIRKSVLVYALKNNTENLIFQNNLTLNQVRFSFLQGFFTFAKYPTLFLAYVKKFKYLKDQNKNSKIIIPVLNHFFEEAIQKLKENGELPFANKIMQASHNSRKQKIDTLLQSLALELSSKLHSN